MSSNSWFEERENVFVIVRTGIIVWLVTTVIVVWIIVRWLWRPQVREKLYRISEIAKAVQLKWEMKINP